MDHGLMIAEGLVTVSPVLAAPAIVAEVRRNLNLAFLPPDSGADPPFLFSALLASKEATIP